MTQWEVRSTADALSAVSFGGRRLRRVPVSLLGQVHGLLLHEDDQTTPYLLAPSGPGTWASLSLNAEWGEPLGKVEQVRADPQTGRVEAYVITGRYPGEVVVSVQDTFWWDGELYCRKRRAYQLRELRRQAERARRTIHPERAA